MSWVGHLVTGVITAAVVGTILNRAFRKPPSFEPETGKATLRYGRWIDWLLGGCLLFTAFGIWGMVYAPEVRRAALLLVLMFGSGVVFIVLERRTTVVVDAAGIEAKTSWRGPRKLAWKDVATVDYSFLASALLLQGRDGTKIRVSSYLTGIATLRSLLLASLDKDVVRTAIERFDRAQSVHS